MQKEISIIIRMKVFASWYDFAKAIMELGENRLRSNAYCDQRLSYRLQRGLIIQY